ncbi:MAG: hypothetical protein CMJ18_00630 [Phycisphaeraceae bacterium]|nr:hypothetical protein [Phycisphaeraceae bacterium]
MEPATRHRLDNGLRVIVAEDRATAAASVGVWTDVGVCDEPDDQRGLAHFLEHMMFRGSEHIGPEEHAHTIARLGGECNAATSPDATMYFDTVPPDAVSEVIGLEADRFQRLDVTDEHTDIERKVILEELRSYENQPAVRAMIEIQKQISDGHAYGLTPLGRKDDLEQTKAEDLTRFFRRCYRPDRAVVVVCGNVDTARVVDDVRQHFGDWRGPDNGHPPAPDVFRPRTGSLSLRLPMEVPVVVQSFGTGPLSDLDTPALDLLVALLAAGASSPIREALVLERRLCVEAGCVPLLLSQGGMLVFFGVFLPPGRHADRRTIIRELIDGLVSDGPDPKLFAQHVKNFRKQRAFENYSPQSRMMGLGKAEALDGDYARFEGELDELAAVTPQRVAELARRIFAPENALELDITPEKSRWWLVPIGLAMKLWPR